MEKKSHLNNALRFGLMVGGILIIVNLIMYLVGMIDLESGKSSFLNTALTWVVNLGGILLGISAYKKDNENYLSVGDGFKQGFFICLLAGILYGIYVLVFFNFIEPDAMETIKENALDKMDEQGSVTEESEGMISGLMNFMFSPVSMFSMTIVSKVIFGMIFGLIIGAIMKNPRPSIEA